MCVHDTAYEDEDVDEMDNEDVDAVAKKLIIALETNFFQLTETSTGTASRTSSSSSSSRRSPRSSTLQESKSQDGSVRELQCRPNARALDAPTPGVERRSSSPASVLSKAHEDPTQGLSCPASTQAQDAPTLASWATKTPDVTLAKPGEVLEDHAFTTKMPCEPIRTFEATAVCRKQLMISEAAHQSTPSSGRATDAGLEQLFETKTLQRAMHQRTFSSDETAGVPVVDLTDDAELTDVARARPRSPPLPPPAVPVSRARPLMPVRQERVKKKIRAQHPFSLNSGTSLSVNDQIHAKLSGGLENTVCRCDDSCQLACLPCDGSAVGGPDERNLAGDAGLCWGCPLHRGSVSSIVPVADEVILSEDETTGRALDLDFTSGEESGDDGYREVVQFSSPPSTASTCSGRSRAKLRATQTPRKAVPPGCVDIYRNRHELWPFRPPGGKGGLCVFAAYVANVQGTIRVCAEEVLLSAGFIGSTIAKLVGLKPLPEEPISCTSLRSGRNVDARVETRVSGLWLAWQTFNGVMVGAAILRRQRGDPAIDTSGGCTLEYIAADRKKGGRGYLLVAACEEIARSIGFNELFSAADLSQSGQAFGGCAKGALAAHEGWGFSTIEAEEWMGRRLDGYTPDSRVCYMKKVVNP